MGPLGDNAKYVSLHYRAYSKCPKNAIFLTALLQIESIPF